jgi:hypothetical protein
MLGDLAYVHRSDFQAVKQEQAQPVFPSHSDSLARLVRPGLAGCSSMLAVVPRSGSYVPFPDSGGVLVGCWQAEEKHLQVEIVEARAGDCYGLPGPRPCLGTQWEDHVDCFQAAQSASMVVLEAAAEVEVR